ncbi:MAG: AGE family epimerase/isomerase [Rhizomicrobium sp.]|nr:AGE family epimerase/isomerase [Rhizomicrobium sp.]
MLDALRAGTQRYENWLTECALPLWWNNGGDHSAGGYYELLSPDDTPPPTNRRARVQSRQSYVYAQAGALGWNGPWREAAAHGIDYLFSHYRQGAGEVSTLVSPQGVVLDSAHMLYDQAFALLATASVYRMMPERGDLKIEAEALFKVILETRSLPQGGFRESGDKAYISNPHMHLLEALLAWCEADPEGNWGEYADRVAELALTKFIDAQGGFLREFFAADWSPAPGADGHVVEPGHQFEWAWLLLAWGKIRGRAEAVPAAQTLYLHGCRGIDPARDAAIHAMDDSFAVTVPTARLWAQTERIKAALALLPYAKDKSTKDALIQDALQGMATLWRYLDTPTKGLWYDRFEPDGQFVVEPSPASTFYHIMCCILCMRQAVA